MTNALHEPHMPILLTAFEAAGILRCHVETLYRWRREGLVQGVALGTALRFTPDEIARVAANGLGNIRKPQPAASAVAVADDSEGTPNE